MSLDNEHRCSQSPDFWDVAFVRKNRKKVPIQIESESTSGEMNLNLNNFVIWVVGDWPPSVFSVLCALAVILLLDS